MDEKTASKSNPTVDVKDSNDKLIFELKDKKYDTLIRNQYSQLTDVYLAKQEFTKLKIVSDILIEKSTTINDTFGIVKGKTCLGGYYLNYAINDSAFYYFNEAEKLSKKTKRKPFLISILNNKATLYWYVKDYKESEKIGIEALKLATEKKDNIHIYGCYLTIANALNGMNNNEKALKYYEKALAIVESLKSDPQYLVFKAQIDNYIASTFRKQNQYQKVINYITEYVDLNQIKRENSSLYCYLLDNIAYSKFKLGDTSSYKQFYETLKIGKEIKNISIELTSKIYLAEFYLSQKDTVKANFYLKEGYTQAHKNKIFEDELKLLQLLIQANANNSSYYSQKYISLNDSLQIVERSVRDKFARIEFETDEIIKQKKIIEEEKNTLLIRLILISGFGLLTIMLIVLWYKNQSQKAKTKQLLLEQEHQKDREEIYQLMLAQQQKIEEGKQIEKRRISQELHDGVMGKLSSIRMNLYVLNKRTDPDTIARCIEYIKEIQNIEKEIRTISHDLNKNLFSENVNFITIVENLFHSIRSHSDINFKMKVDERIEWNVINNDIKINIYRIIQEALQNIDKYSKASNVSIEMTKKEETIEIKIEDDGIGFNAENQRSGIGLKNMKSRMEEINGHFQLITKPNKGTKINLLIPN